MSDFDSLRSGRRRPHNPLDKRYVFKLRIDPGLSFNSIRIVFAHERCAEIPVDVEESAINAPQKLLDFAEVMIDAEDANSQPVQIADSPDCFLAAQRWFPSGTVDVLLRHVHGDYLYQSLHPHAVALCICDAVNDARSVIESEGHDNGWRFPFPLAELAAVQAAMNAVQQ